MPSPSCWKAISHQQVLGIGEEFEYLYEIDIDRLSDELRGLLKQLPGMTGP
jgi:hypothetical protein